MPGDANLSDGRSNVYQTRTLFCPSSVSFLPLSGSWSFLPRSQAATTRSGLVVPAGAEAQTHHLHGGIRLITAGRAMEDESVAL